MPGLTVTEKEHWKNRIARRIDKKIETLQAGDPNLMERIERNARERALTSLGLAVFQAELDQLAQEQEALQKRKYRVEREMLARVRGVPVDTLDTYIGHSATQEVERSVHRRKAVHEDELLAGSDIGRRILQLRAEKEELLDTVWLASSTAQLKTLWSKVAELLGEEQTALQRDALAIAPVTE